MSKFDHFLDVEWLQQRLQTTDIDTLLADFAALPLPDTSLPNPHLLVRHTLQLSAAILRKDKDQLTAQLYARLVAHHHNPESPLAEFIHQLTPTVQSIHPTMLQAQDTFYEIPLPHSGHLSCITDPQTHILVASLKQVYVFEIETQNLITQFEAHQETIMRIQIHKQFAVSLSLDNIIHVWRWDTGEHLATLAGHTHTITDIVIRENHVFSASYDKTVIVWDYTTGEMLTQLDTQKSGVIKILAVGQYVVAGTITQSLYVWNWQLGKLIARTVNHKAHVREIFADGTKIIIPQRGKRGDIHEWDWQTNTVTIQKFSGEQPHNINSHDYPLLIHGDIIFGKTYDKHNNQSIIVYNQKTGNVISHFSQHQRPIKQIHVDGNVAYSMSEDNHILMWDWQTGAMLNEFLLRGHNLITAQLFCHLAIGLFDDRTIKIWRLDANMPPSEMRQHRDRVDDVIMIGDTVVSVAENMRLWRWEDGTPILDVVRFKRQQRSNYISLKKHQAEAIIEQHEIVIRDWQTNTAITTLTGHTAAIRTMIAFDDLIVSGSADYTVKVWRWRDGSLLTDFTKHQGVVKGLARAGTFMLSVGYDDTLRIWNWQIGEEYTRFTVGVPLNCVAVNQRQNVVLVGDTQGHVHVLKVNLQPLS